MLRRHSRADVQQSNARVAAARATLTGTVLPFAGVVVKIIGEVGENPASTIYTHVLRLGAKGVRGPLDVD